jgi:predicted Rossmann-fold nucleotide-binding protein
LERALRSFCDFCGSRPGNDPAYEALPRRLGWTLAERGAALVYGGGRAGLMGVVADAVLDAGGRL